MSGSNIQKLPNNAEASIPVYGAMTRPANPESASKALGEERFEAPARGVEIVYESDEFTSVCPRTGQPDFNRVRIRYIADGFCIESKAMKFYLWSFREHGAFCETLAVEIARHVDQAIKPLETEVTVFQNKRGGIALTATHRIFQQESADENE